MGIRRTCTKLMTMLLLLVLAWSSKSFSLRPTHHWRSCSRRRHDVQSSMPHHQQHHHHNFLPCNRVRTIPNPSLISARTRRKRGQPLHASSSSASSSDQHSDDINGDNDDDAKRKEDQTGSFNINKNTNNNDNENKVQKQTRKKNLWNRFIEMLPPQHERKKMIPLAIMFFCILFNYTILRSTKDVLVSENRS